MLPENRNLCYGSCHGPNRTLSITIVALLSGRGCEKKKSPGGQCNPLKRPNSAKEIQAFFFDFLGSPLPEFGAAWEDLALTWKAKLALASAAAEPLTHRDAFASPNSASDCDPHFPFEDREYAVWLLGAASRLRQSGQARPKNPARSRIAHHGASLVRPSKHAMQ